MKKLLLVLTAFAVAAGVTTGSTALAAGTPSAPEISLFSGGTGVAQWVTQTPGPPGATDTESIQLAGQASGPTDYANYAGARLLGVEGALPTAAPSFYYFSNQAGASLGSPRLHISFSDGGSADLRPEVLVPGVWTKVDGTTNDWDSNGGSCGYKYRPDYATIIGCHAGASVVGVSVINDSAYAYAPALLDIRVDSIRYGAAFVTKRTGTKLTAAPVVAKISTNKIYVTIGALKTKLTTTAGVAIAGRTISFHAGGALLCTAVTSSTGVATCNAPGAWLKALFRLGYTADFAGDGTYNASSARGYLVNALGIRI